MNDNYSVVIFFSTSAAVRAESLTQKKSLEVKLIPVPRNLSSDCGICLQINTKDKEKIEKILLEGKVEYDNIFNL